MSEIRGALARGYCTKENENKTVDATLIEAMAVEVENSIRTWAAGKKKKLKRYKEKLRN